MMTVLALMTPSNVLFSMPPNIALSTHNLTLNIISNKLKGRKAPTDDDTARLAYYSTRTIRRHRSNYLCYGSTKAPPNGGGRPASVTPVMMSTLRSQLAVKPYMRLREMVAFLRKEFDVEVTRFSIRRALAKDGE